MRYLFILFACVHLSASAQSWCPPGATWIYGSEIGGTFGIQVYSVEGDTIIDGITGQKISVTSYDQTYWDPGSVVITFYPAYHITALQNDVVMQWSPYVQEWDTLFWFAATPGDFWHYDPYGDCPDAKIVVVDTTTIVIDGIGLKQLTIDHQLDGEFMQWTSHLTERLGWEWMFAFEPPCYSVTGPTGQRCYYDDQIFYSDHEYGCVSLLNVRLHSGIDIRVSPNPGTEHFTLQLPPRPHQLTLFDAQGRVVLRQQLSDERPVISTSSLPSGIYHIHLTDGNGRISGQRWVKE